MSENPPHSEGESDADLVALIVRGDTQAFTELYARWSPSLFGLVCRILNDPKEAEDVLQEGFLHLWHKAGTYDSQRSSPTTWAFMIFRNKAIDRLRARERRGRGMEKLASENQDDFFGESPSYEASSQERRSAIHAALDGIPSDQREAIDLAFFTGLSQTEIAEQLGAPLGTIKARIRRGMMKLADLLEGKI